MLTLIIIFLTIATLFALATIGYVVVDVVVEKNNKKEEPVVVPVVPPVVEPEPEPEPVFIPIPVVEPMPVFTFPVVEHVNAEEADDLVPDEVAMENANYEKGAGHGQQNIINIGVLDRHFEANDVVTLQVLKERGLISKKTGRMKILADGILNKPLTIKAESYSIQAIKMIELMGGKVIILKD